MPHILRAALAALTLAAQPAIAQVGPVAEAVQDYMNFAAYEAGIVLPDQLTDDMLANVTFVDTRSADQFAAATLPGAVNIDWREIPARLDELPETGLVVLFCNTGSLSAQAAFAGRLLGRENVLVLQGGFTGWQARGGA